MIPPRPRTRIARRLGVGLLTVLGLLAVAELAARLFGPAGEPPPLRFQFASRLDANLDYEGLFRRSTSLLWELHPGARFAADERINAHELRGPELPPGEDGFRVALLGDSCTFGFGVSHDQTYGARLERLLRQAHPRAEVRVLNAGVPGYSVLQVARRFEEDVVPLDPDAVVLYVGAWNDFNPAMAEDGSDLDLVRKSTSDPLGRAYGWLRHSRLFELFAMRYAGTLRYRHWRATLDAWLAGEPPHGYRVPLDEFGALFASLLDRCAELGLPCLVILPALDESRRAKEPIHWQRADAYRAVMLSAAEERGIPVLDQREVVGGANHEGLFLDVVHPSAKGHRLLARALAERITRAGWLE